MSRGSRPLRHLQNEEELGVYSFQLIQRLLKLAYEPMITGHSLAAGSVNSRQCQGQAPH